MTLQEQTLVKTLEQVFDAVDVEEERADEPCAIRGRDPKVRAQLVEGVRVAFQRDQAGWWDAMSVLGLLDDEE